MRNRLAILTAVVLATVAASAHPQNPSGAGDGAFYFEHFLPTHGRLGVQLQTMTPELREFLRAPKDRGVLVVRVTEGSPAQKAGLRVGDVIVGVGGEPVAATADIVRAVMTAEKDAKLPLEVFRDGKSRQLEATLPDEPPMAGRSMRWMEERWPEFRDQLEERMRELEERLRELEQRLQASPPAAEQRT